MNPNILIIHSDQHRFDCLGINGHPTLRTPNLDRLAAEGVNFSQAYTPVPLCVPARNCQLVGCWPTDHLCIANYDTEAPRGAIDGLPAYSRMLSEAGYRTAYLQKWHVDQQLGPSEFGFEQVVEPRQWAEARREAGYDLLKEANWFGQIDPAPEQWSRLNWDADRVIDLLGDTARDDRPFFIRWDPFEPHLPCQPPRRYAEMYPVEEVPPWPGSADTLAGKPYIQRQMRRTWGLDEWTWDQWAPVVARYLAVITQLDDQVGRVLKELEQLGLAENTLVIYTTDHGDMCGSRGMIDKHNIMYDDVVHVPMVMRWPGRIDPGQTCDEFVCHELDLASTLLEVAGLEPPETFRGTSLVPVACDGGSTGREDIFSMYFGNQFGLFSQRMVRDRRWKYVFNATARDELYHLAEDPAELTNRIDDPACAGELARLRRRMVTWMESIDDTLLNTWTRPLLLEGRKV